MHLRRPWWKPLDAGYVKTNFDRAIFKDLQAAGIGVVIRDEHGKVIAILAEKISILELVLTLGTLEARQAVQFVQELRPRNSIFEGDYETSINVISKGDLLHSSCGHIIKDILLTSTSLQSFFFLSHINRYGNILVDAFAKKAKFSFPLLVWMEFVPPDFYKCYLLAFSAIE